MEVIAEIGSNFKTLDDCVSSIRQAKQAGANIVKFQLYTFKELYGVEGVKMPGELPREWIHSLSEVARREGIEFMCTGFSAGGYRFLNPYVKRHKVASSELPDIELLSTLNSLGKPVILSTGGSTLNEIGSALLMLRNVQVTLMYCVVDYPARVVDLRHLELMKDRFGDGCSYGYSDHSTDVLHIPFLAKSFGAVVLEKHVNFTNHTDTPDAPHSLSASEFQMMTQRLKSRLKPEETFQPNPWKRKMITLPNGMRGFYRPLPDAS